MSSNAQPITVELHDLTLSFHTGHAPLQTRFEQVYGHLPRRAASQNNIHIDWTLIDAAEAPLPPPDMPVISEGILVSYYGTDERVAVRLPRYSLITVDLAHNRLTGQVTSACLEAYGVFEDALMIALAPLYRRQGWYPLHAFAALSPQGRVALLTGAMGSGKTTTGLALLDAGWKLLSNDSPLLTLDREQVKVLAYPGQLSAFDDSLALFKSLHRFIPDNVANLLPTGAASAGPKRVFGPDEVFEAPWATSGVAGGIFFPQVTAGLNESELVAMPPTEALLKLMPQAIEGWDKSAIGQSLALLGRLVEQVPAYLLRLSPHVEQLPALIGKSLT